MATNDFLSNVFGGASGVGAVDAYGKNVAAASAQGAGAMGQAGIQGMQSYMNDYRPYDKKFMGYVDNLGTDAYRAQQRGQAMTGVQQQIDMQRQAQNRDMARMGVNPNSARFATMNGMLAGQGALNKAMAATSADRASRAEWAQGLGAINAMGTKLADTSQKSMQTAAELGKVGLAGADLGASAMDRQTNASANMAGANASNMNASTNATRLAQDAQQFGQNYQLGLGRLALDREALATGNYLKQQGIDATNQQNSFGNVLASGAVGAGLRYLTTPQGMQTMGNLFGGGSSAPIFTQADGSFSVVPPGSFAMDDYTAGALANDQFLTNWE